MTIFETESIALLKEIARVLHSIDTGITDVVHVIEENTEAITGAVDGAADRIAAAVEPKEEG